MLDKQHIKKEHLLDSESKRDSLLAYLSTHYPETLSEGRLNLEALSRLLGLEISERGYELNFTGKPLATALYGRKSTKELKLESHFTPSNSPEDSKDSTPYPHTIIKGDNLDALKLLKSAYTEKIKMIYIDPPYNTHSENFIYNDSKREDFTQILREVGLLYANEEGLEVESESLQFFRNITGSRSHSGWLAFMLPRLKLARDLLRDDGVIFISIDDNEQANLKLLCDEIFGEENFVACCPVVTNRGGRDYGGIAITHEYILIYQKDIKGNELNLLADENKKFTFCDEHGNFNLMELRNRNIKFNSENRPNLYYPFYVNPNRKDENDLYEISLTKHKDFIEVYPIQSQGINTVWRWGKEKAQKFLNTDIKAKKKKDGGFMIVQKYRSILKRQKSVFDSVEYITEKGSNAIKDILNAKVFDYPKSIFLIKDLLKIATTSPLQCGGGGATRRIA